MQKHRHLAWHRATAEEVLAVFQADYEFNQEWHPDSCCWDDERLSFETTVRDWRRMNPLVEWRSLGLALNRWFRVDFDEATWRQTLLPEKKRTLRDVCELLATKAWLPQVNMRPLLGAPCATGSTFLAMCELMRKQGLPTKGLRPSTPLAEYARRYPGSIFTALTSLAPGVLPVPREHRYARSNRADLACGFSFALGCLSLYWSNVPLIVFSALAFSVSIYAIAHNFEDPPEWVTFGDLVTFGDMARVIAEGGHAQPTQ
jgi:hypothetical protein